MIRGLLLCLALLLASSSHAQLLALCYHDVTLSTEDALRDAAAVSVERLIKQFNWLQANGYEPVSLDRVIDARQGGPALPERAVLLTFDDGYSSFYDRVLPLLQLYRFPAVLAVVTSWVDAPPGATIDYGGRPAERSRFLDWARLEEIAATGLVEIVSHSHDLHRGIVGNPQGNTQPAATTLAYDDALSRYETMDALLDRVRADLSTSVGLLERRLSRKPRAMVWPYGQYSAALQQIATDLGMPVSFTLDDLDNSTDDPDRIHRLLIGSDMGLSEFTRAVRDRYIPTPIRAAHVDLDYVYDPDPAQQEKNLSLLLDRIKAMHLSTVILQAFADPDGNGAADALYYPNRHLPMRADLFNRVSWQLGTRAGVKVYAWLPVLAFELPTVQSPARVASATPSAESAVPRLSPFDERSAQIIEELYVDLAASSHFSGLLFHDDATLSDDEDASETALQFYHQRWGLPPDLEIIRAHHRAEFMRLKTDHLIGLTQALSDTVRRYRPTIKTARNLFAPTVLNPESEAWFAQNFEKFLTAYDYTALMAMPFLEGANRPNQWLEDLVERVAAHPSGIEKTLFELQTIDWRTGRPLSEKELTEHLDTLLYRGARHIAYYPDDFLTDHPGLGLLRSRLSVNTYAALLE